MGAAPARPAQYEATLTAQPGRPWQGAEPVAAEGPDALRVARAVAALVRLLERLLAAWPRRRIEAVDAAVGTAALRYQRGFSLFPARATLSAGCGALQLVQRGQAWAFVLPPGAGMAACWQALCAPPGAAGLVLYERDASGAYARSEVPAQLLVQKRPDAVP